ncbi:hypothetical protein WNY98_12285 [Pseudoalteromonas sp. AS71]|uniref:hypothetical protein n=1 Tax=Pseudoalteromonas sp. AS71 TaxID=3135777 RepID=UPI0031801AAE
MNRSFFLTIPACLLLNFFWPVYAIEVRPMVITFSPNEDANSLVRNDLTREIAFDIQIFEIKFSEEDAKEEPKLKALTDSPLWVFPPSLYLEPGQAQQLQFKWLTEILPESDKSYQISLIEQPILNHSTTSGPALNLRLNVNLVVHVDQVKLKPNLVVTPLSIEGNYITTNIKNIGPGASRLSEYDLNFIDINSEVLVQRVLKQQLRAKGYDVFFAPHSISHIEVPVSTSINKNNLKQLYLKLEK